LNTQHLVIVAIPGKLQFLFGFGWAVVSVLR
jgi:hypothetical protein